MKLKVSGMAKWGMSTDFNHFKELVIDTENDSFSIEKHYGKNYLTVTISKHERPLENWYDKVMFLKDTFKQEII